MLPEGVPVLSKEVVDRVRAEFDIGGEHSLNKGLKGPLTDEEYMLIHFLYETKILIGPSPTSIPAASSIFNLEPAERMKELVRLAKAKLAK